jgi:hypothetical protein
LNGTCVRGRTSGNLQGSLSERYCHLSLLVHILYDAAHLHRLLRRFDSPQHVVALTPAARGRRLCRELPPLYLPPLCRARGELQGAVKGQVVRTQLKHNVARPLPPPADYPFSKLHSKDILRISGKAEKAALSYRGQVLPVPGSTWRWHASSSARK